MDLPVELFELERAAVDVPREPVLARVDDDEVPVELELVDDELCVRLEEPPIDDETAAELEVALDVELAAVAVDDALEAAAADIDEVELDPDVAAELEVADPAAVAELPWELDEDAVELEELEED